MLDNAAGRQERKHPLRTHGNARNIAAATATASASAATATTTKISTTFDSNNDSSSTDYELDVLPPKSSGGTQQLSRSRLRHSGMDSNDPVTLLFSDNDSVDKCTRTSGPLMEVDSSKLAPPNQTRRRSSGAFSASPPSSPFSFHDSLSRTSSIHNHDDEDSDVVEVLVTASKRQKGNPVLPVGSNLQGRSLPKYNDTITFSSDSEFEELPNSMMMAKAQRYQKTTTDKRERLSQSTETTALSLQGNEKKDDHNESEQFRTFPQMSHATGASPICSHLMRIPGAAQSNKGWSDDSDDSSDNSLTAMSKKFATKRKVAATTNDTVPQSNRLSAVANKAVTKNCTDQKVERAKAKETEKLQKQQERSRLRQEKEDAKAAVALAKEQKKDAKQVDKREKERQKIEFAQASGKLARNEIAVLMQLDQFPSSKYSVIADLEAKYLVQDHPSALRCNAVQWIRKDAALGGAAAAVQELHCNLASRAASNTPTEYHHFPILAIVVSDAVGFLKLLERPDRASSSSRGDGDDCFDDDDYPALEQWLKGVEIGWRAAWSIQSRTGAIGERITSKPRFILLLDRILETLDKLWIQFRKTATRTAQVPPTAEDVHDAISWILIQFQVECVHCTCAEDISTHLLKMTRLLAEVPYRRVVGEVECIQKLRPECFETDPPHVKAKDCWMRQLQQVPRLSRPIAEQLVHYFPNPQSLYQAYLDPKLSLDEKLMLTANLMGQTTKAKLSTQLYTVLTSTDPNESLH